MAFTVHEQPLRQLLMEFIKDMHTVISQISINTSMPSTAERFDPIFIPVEEMM